MQTAIFGNNQRIDFKHRHVFFEEAIIERAAQFICLLGEVAFQVKRFRQGTTVMRHETCRRINVKINDFFRCVMRNGLNVHAAFGRDDERDARRFTVDNDGKIKLAVNV